MRRWLAIVGALVIGLIVCIVGMRRVASQHENAAMVMLGNGARALPQGCWYALCPTETSDDRAAIRVMEDIAKAHGARAIKNLVLEEGGYLVPYSACITPISPHWSACLNPEYGESTLLRIKLWESHLRLDDFVTVLGPPSGMWMCQGSPDFTDFTSEGVVVSLVYANGVMVSAYKASKYNPPVYPMPPDEWRVSRDMRVYKLTFSKAQPYMAMPDNEVYFTWRGFAEGPIYQNSCGN